MIVNEMNQFAQTPIKGMLAAVVNPTTISAQVDQNSPSTIKAGDAVRLTATVGFPIIVDLVTDAALAAYGFVIYSLKKGTWTAGDMLEVAPEDSIIYLESSGVISRGNLLEFVPGSPGRVKKWAGVNPTVALALDNATATGQLLRGQVIMPKDTEFSSSSSCRSSSSSCRSSSSSSSSSTSV